MMGWDITVVTEDIPENTFSFLADNTNVTYIKYYNASGKITKRLEWIWIMILDILFRYKTNKMFKACNKLVQKNHYGTILCSTYRTFPLPVAHKLSQKHGIPFIADMRDIIEQFTSDEYILHKIHIHPLLDKWIIKLVRKQLLNERNKTLRAAESIITVSPWHVQTLQVYNPNVHLIYNGFDPDFLSAEESYRPFLYYLYRQGSQPILTKSPTSL